MHSTLQPLSCTAHRFPVELWTRIFSHACTDDGGTGRALSLVSRYIRRASAPHKLQSVLITSVPQMLAFTKVLEHTEPPLRRVHTLTLRFDASASSSFPRNVTRLQSLLRAQQSNMVFSTLSHILSLLSRSLHCLSTSLQSLPTRPSTFLPPLPLPSLTHLFIASDDFPLVSTHDPARAVSSLPCLRTIELVLCNSTFSEELMPYLAALAPGLVGLTVCAASPAQAVLVLGGGYWGVGSASPEDEVFAGAPNTLESVQIVPRSGWNEEWEAFKCSVGNEQRITVDKNQTDKYRM